MEKNKQVLTIKDLQEILPETDCTHLAAWTGFMLELPPETELTIVDGQLRGVATPTPNLDYFSARDSWVKLSNLVVRALEVIKQN